MSFELAAESFPWESDAQQEGYMAFVKFQKQFGRMPEDSIDLALAFMIQKNHETYEWVQEAFGDQVSALQLQIKLIQEENHGLKKQMELLELVIKTNTGTLELFTKGNQNAKDG